MILLIIGILMLIIATAFKMFPPEHINYFYGYRTRLSKSNEILWKEAQRYSAITMIILSIILISIGFVLNLMFNTSSILLLVQFVLLLISLAIMIFIDENHLKSYLKKI